MREGPSSADESKAPRSRAPGRVLVAGATGYIGRHVAAELIRRGVQVLALVRPESGMDDPLLEDCERLEVEISDAQALATVLAPVRAEAIISCLASRNGVPGDAWRIDHDANSGLLGLAKGLGVRHFVLLSAICVQKPRLAFQQAKLAFEAELRAAPIDGTVVRPTAFFKSLSGQVERVRAGKPFLVFGDGTLTACKPIAETDLAAFIVDCLFRDERRGKTLPIGGPGPALTPLEQGRLLHEALGRKPAFRHVSPRILSASARVLDTLGRLVPPLAVKAELARIGHYYATESMLVWDEKAGRYDAAATPEAGTETLGAFYRRVADEGLADQQLGDHRLFD